MENRKFPRAGQEQCRDGYSQLERLRRRIKSITAAEDRDHRDEHGEENRRTGRSKKDAGDKTESAAKFSQHREKTPEARDETEADQPVERAAEPAPESDAAHDFGIAMHDHEHRPDSNP